MKQGTTFHNLSIHFLHQRQDFTASRYHTFLLSIHHFHDTSAAATKASPIEAVVNSTVQKGQTNQIIYRLKFSETGRDKDYVVFPIYCS